MLRAVRRGERVEDPRDAELAAKLATSPRRVFATALSNRVRVVSFAHVIGAAVLQGFVFGGGLIWVAAVAAVLGLPGNCRVWV